MVQISAGGDVKFQRSHLEDLARELQGFRAKFEPLLARLSSYSTDEATALMSRALEMMDTITNSIKLKDEVGLAAPAWKLPCSCRGWGAEVGGHAHACAESLCMQVGGLLGQCGSARLAFLEPRGMSMLGASQLTSMLYALRLQGMALQLLNGALAQI